MSIGRCCILSPQAKTYLISHIICFRRKTLGLHHGDIQPENIRANGFGSDFEINGQKFHLNIPGLHNVANATASVAAALECEVDLKTAAAQPGDILLVLGARDPTLTDFAKKLLHAVEQKQKTNCICQECMLGNCCMAYLK